MPANERRLWPRVKVHKHVLGELKYIYLGERRVRALMVYEEAVERNNVPQEMPSLRMRLVGDAHEIRCSICKCNVADWDAGEDAIQELLSRVLKRDV
ncbi:MAG: hypothetical protein HY865_09520 [Chloroflexi bacterium]|nr:hypothetical protein [Chloroflexota bacterium]